MSGQFWRRTNEGTMFLRNLKHHVYVDIDENPVVSLLWFGQVCHGQATQ